MMGKAVFAAAVAVLLSGTAHARWPYLTEEASVLGEGRFSVALGVSETFQESAELPGGEGTLWTFPEVEVTLGVGPQAEVSAEYELFWFDPEGEEDGEYESGDVRLWTKLLLFPSRVQNLALRFGVKLPNASNESGLGTDETDAFLSVLYGAWLGPVRVTGNAGLGLLGDPTKSGSQDDVFTWGAAARWPVVRSLWVGCEAAGWSGPFGVDRKRDFATFAGVVDWDVGPFRLSAAGRRGIEDAESWGWVAGVTYVH